MKRIKKTIQSILSGPPKKKSEVEAAIRQIMNYIRPMQEQGIIEVNLHQNDLLI